jgi:uncharacterized protein
MDEPGLIVPKRLRRILARIFYSAVTIYLIVCIVIFSIQSWLIFPGADSHGQPSSVIHADSQRQLLDLTATDGVKIAAIFGGPLAPSEAEPPTILYCYGNGMCLADCDSIFFSLRRLGFNVIIPEFEGYGMSGGSAGEQGCYAAAAAAYDWLLKNPDIDSHRIVAAGWSLGAAVSIDLAAHHPVAGVATFSAFTSMADMGHQLYPWLPVSLLIRHRFDNLPKMRKLKCPILLVHGAQDDLVPPWMCSRLAAAAGSNAQQIIIPRAGHLDVFDIGGGDLFRQVRHFVQSLAPRGP